MPVDVTATKNLPSKRGSRLTRARSSARRSRPEIESMPADDTGPPLPLLAVFGRGPPGPVADVPEDRLAVGSAGFEAPPAREGEGEQSVTDPLRVRDRAKVEEQRLVDANEAARRERGAQVLQRVAAQITAVRRVHRDVVQVRLDVLDGVDVDEVELPRALADELGRRATRF